MPAVEFDRPGPLTGVGAVVSRARHANCRGHRRRLQEHGVVAHAVMASSGRGLMPGCMAVS